DIAEREDFLDNLLSKRTEKEVKEYLLHNDRYINITLDANNPFHRNYINKKVKEIIVPKGILLAIIERGNETITPDGDTVLKDKDTLTIIGNPKRLKLFQSKMIILEKKSKK
ncbi:MAG: TrkA C-terminal domain-containing protein, partial [Bacteroidota bacterium]